MIAGLAAAQSAHAQTQPPPSGPPRVQTNPLTISPNGRFTATNVTLVDLIVRAYPTRRIQMQGGPDWIDSDRFDISAKADTTDSEIKLEEWNLMIQALLEDRFKLVLHRETKEMSVYALVAGKNPPKLRASKEGEQTALVPGEHGRMNFQSMPMVGLVNTLANILREPVVDGTGIKGFFDFTLDPMQFAATDDPRVPNNVAELVLSAVRQQLGFILEKRKAPLEITIVDHAEKPGDN